MPNIFDYVSAPEIAAYIEQLLTNAIPIFGEALFPRQRQNGTDISWLKGRDGIPVAITPSNYDAKATLRERTGFGKMETEMAFFREATRIGEKDRQEINKLLNHPNSSIALPIINRIFDDVARLVEGVAIQAEYMRMQLLQYGKFIVTNLDQTARYEYDYSMAEECVYNIEDPWDDYETSQPVKDLLLAADEREMATGIRPNRAVMNRTTFLNMVASESIKKDLMIGVTPNWQNFFLGEAEAKAYIERKTGISIMVYAKKIGVLDPVSLTPNLDSSTFVNLIDDGNVCLFPSVALGNTWYGTTPEESDLMNGVGTSAAVSLVNGGVAITTYREPHPVNVSTIVSAVMIPSFERINNVAVLKTLAEIIGTDIESALFDVTAPVKTATPQASHASGVGYTAAIAWSPVAASFAAETVYTATVTLTAAEGYRFPKDFKKADVVGLPGTAVATSSAVTRVSEDVVKIVVVYKATDE